MCVSVALSTGEWGARYFLCQSEQQPEWQTNRNLLNDVLIRDVRGVTGQFDKTKQVPRSLQMPPQAKNKWGWGIFSLRLLLPPPSSDFLFFSPLPSSSLFSLLLLPLLLFETVSSCSSSFASFLLPFDLRAPSCAAHCTRRWRRRLQSRCRRWASELPRWLRPPSTGRAWVRHTR